MLDAIETHVADGFGIGLSVSIPKTKMSPKVRALALEGLVPVVLRALWHGKLTPLVRALLDELRSAAGLLHGLSGKDLPLKVELAKELLLHDRK